MIREALQAYVLTSNRVWGHDRKQTVGASEIGQCARKVAFNKLSGEPGAVERDDDYEDGWGAARRGTVIEDHFWAPAMRMRFGDDLLWSGNEQKTFTSGYLSATPDGVLVNLAPDTLADLGVANCGESVLLDCKSIDPRVRLDKPKDEHVYQMIVGMGVVREATNYRPEWAILSYIDASFWDQVIEFAVRFDPEVYAVAKDRARQIMTADSGASLRPEGIIAGGRECDYCAFASQCGRVRAGRVPSAEAAVDAQTLERVTTLARLVKASEADAKKAETEAANYKQNIRDLMAAAGTKSVPGVAQWSSVKGREGWDDKAIRAAAEAAGIDLSPFKRVGDASDRLTIKLKEHT